MAHKIVQTALLLCIFVECLLSQCPPESMISPCKCSYPSLVACEHISDMNVLVDVFKRSADRTFYSFNLTSSTVMYLPAHAVTSKKMRWITINNCTLAALFDSEPSTDNKVSVISLQKVRFLRGVGWTLFKNLKSLTRFYAHHTEIRLGKAFVENMSVELNYLSIRDCKVTKIYPNAFQNLRKLTYFEMSNSFVEEWKRSMFSTPSFLSQMLLSGNQIDFLPDDMFSDMNMLKEVRLDNNRISTFSEAVFGNLFIVKGRDEPYMTLDLTGNPIKCDCSVRWYFKERDWHLRSGRTHGTCAYPEDKKGKSLRFLQPNEFNYCE